jgi:hypothetical protein
LNRRPVSATVLVAAFALLGATPAPTATVPDANHLTAAQMKALVPKVALHTVYVVAVNKLGQVSGAKAKVLSRDKTRCRRTSAPKTTRRSPESTRSRTTTRRRRDGSRARLPSFIPAG